MSEMSSSQRIEKALLDGDGDAYDSEASHRFWTGMYLFIGWVAAWWIGLGIIVWALSV
ncbi:hypothetical protein [Methyloceanibacter sp.]|jgi:hypothetical protein|uniref:hypothetical protein n=1 Tax=Methyloceanibacter sp. TaxID=1965321 RepID=UPI00356775DC